MTGLAGTIGTVVGLVVLQQIVKDGFGPKKKKKKSKKAKKKG